MHEVCLVIPCYNEERRLRGDEILEFLASHSHASVCLVNDGSCDGTLKLLEALKARDSERVLVLSLARNSGKAEAVRHGVLHVSASHRFAFIGYWDADLSTPLRELEHLLDPFDVKAGYGLSMGSRVKRLGSDIQRNTARHYLGRVFSTLAGLLLDLPVYDSQCGAKVFRAELAGVLFGEPFVTKWIFDLEILARLRNHLGWDGFLNSTVEVPLNAWRDVGGSKLRVTDVVRIPCELFRIRSRYATGARRWRHSRDA